MRAPRACALLLFAALGACVAPEDIRVRDQSAVLAHGRARWTRPVGRVGLGVEVGGFGTTGDYLSPTGRKRYDVTVGYVAVAAEARLGRFTLSPHAGLGIGEFAVEGEARRLRENGLGGLVGLEARLQLAGPLDAFARADWFRRSSLDATFAAVGVAWRPAGPLALELGYGVSDNVIEEGYDPFGASDGADVRAQGLLLGVSATF